MILSTLFKYRRVNLRVNPNAYFSTSIFEQCRVYLLLPGHRPRHRQRLRNKHETGYGCISMQRSWSSLRYSFHRTLFLLAADLRRHPTPAHPFPVSSVVLVWPVPRGVSVIPRAVSLRVSSSQSTGRSNGFNTVRGGVLITQSWVNSGYICDPPPGTSFSEKLLTYSSF